MPTRSLTHKFELLLTAVEKRRQPLETNWYWLQLLPRGRENKNKKRKNVPTTAGTTDAWTVITAAACRLYQNAPEGNKNLSPKTQHKRKGFEKVSRSPAAAGMEHTKQRVWTHLRSPPNLSPSMFPGTYGTDMTQRHGLVITLLRFNFENLAQLLPGNSPFHHRPGTIQEKLSEYTSRLHQKIFWHLQVFSGWRMCGEIWSAQNSDVDLLTFKQDLAEERL